MTNESYTPDELTPEQELDNIIHFADVIVSLPSTGDMARNYAKSIIGAVNRVKDSMVGETKIETESR